MDQLLNLTARMAQQGIRRLLVLSGDDAWSLEQALLLRKRLAGDGLWVGRSLWKRPVSRRRPSNLSSGASTATPSLMPAAASTR
ncbi:hypothetical protein UA70_27965, partial [Raoultella planticola]